MGLWVLAKRHPADSWGWPAASNSMPVGEWGWIQPAMERDKIVWKGAWVAVFAAKSQALPSAVRRRKRKSKVLGLSGVPAQA